jgi:FMN phosphatase YigB (HAD superfamily)
MKTIICDIDGTLTNMWPIERTVLMRLLSDQNAMKLDRLKSLEVSETYRLFCRITRKRTTKLVYQNLYQQAFEYCKAAKLFPALERYSVVDWIVQNCKKIHFVYATGGQREESLYVLEQLDILQYFDLKHSVDKTSCCFGKRTGIPFKKILRKYPNAVLLTDSESDCLGASKVGLSYIYLSNPTEQLLKLSQID